MNIIELVKSILMDFPKIGEVCNDIHVDFTDPEPTNYGISSTGDALISEDILGGQKRRHNFILYAVFQSQSDYDRMANSGVLLEMAYWLEQQAKCQSIHITVGDKKMNGRLMNIVCDNGMLYELPNENMNSGVIYQLQIAAFYDVESGV